MPAMFQGALQNKAVSAAAGPFHWTGYLLALGLALLGSQFLPGAARAEIVAEQAKIWSPEILSGTDREKYLSVLAAQKKGDWTRADKLISQLSDKRLMGYMLADRYLHPRYKSKYSELKSWMAQYATQPGADRIYALAIRKRPGGAAMPERPQRQRFRQVSRSGEDKSEDFSDRFRTADQAIRAYVRDDKANAAQRYLDGPLRSSLTTAEYNKVRERIAASYFIENDNENAYRVASEIAASHSSEVPMGNWYAGLAAWRMERYAVAAKHFEKLARSSTANNWNKAAGGFWAARAYVANRQPHHVAPMLELAASTGANFYGLLAARQLGREIKFTWIEPTLDYAGFQALIADEAVARAVALVQIGKRDLAEMELVRAHGWLSSSLDQPLIALATTFRMPAVALQVASSTSLPNSRSEGDKIVINAGLYPVPDYRPANGYRVDRALLFAVMRQESKFRPDAQSPAGARGLMQIMPATASLITRDSRLGGKNKDRLLDPAFNLALGQQYLEKLMGSGEQCDNLFTLATAYNGGPGNLSRWLVNINFKGDPFLFIESIPAQETRSYIERVLTNFWIYRERLGRPSKSLDATAAGTWPAYGGLEKFDQGFAAN
jgi:soluble lytic murein transglycosylase